MVLKIAGEVYEIVFEPTSRGNRLWRTVFVLITNLFAMGAGPRNPGGMILSVRNRKTGEEIFRHIEDLGDDEGHMLAELQRDLDEMSVAEFEARWRTDAH